MYTTWYNGAPTTNPNTSQTTCFSPNWFGSCAAIGYQGTTNPVSDPALNPATNYDGSNNYSINQDLYKYFQFENRMLGLPRLRQLRVSIFKNKYL